MFTLEKQYGIISKSNGGKRINQILMIENNKKNKRKKGIPTPIEIKKIIRFFAIFIIVFSLTIISHSSYALYREAKGNNTENLPQISISRKNDTLIVNVKSLNVINKFKYNWEKSEETSIIEETKEFSEEIILPNGNNVLTMTLEDENGRAITYTKEILLEGIDITKPTIEIRQGQGSSIIISALDETKIKYITYRIDDGEEKRIDKNNEEDKKIEYVVSDIPRGEHLLHISAVDNFGNIEEIENSVIVSSDRPTIKNLSIDKENGKIIVEVTDVDGIKTIWVNLNGAEYNLDNINKTEMAFSLNLKQGKNTLSIKITNVNGLTTEGATEFDYGG